MAALIGVDLIITGQQQFVKHSRKSRNRFFYNLESGHGQYIAALAGFLPFRSNSVDFVYSTQAVSRFLLKKKEIFQNAMWEILRVLKVEGVVQIQPWISNVYDWSQEERETACAFLQDLEDLSIPYQVESLPRLYSPRLRITKPQILIPR